MRVLLIKVFRDTCHVRIRPDQVQPRVEKPLHLLGEPSMAGVERRPESRTRCRTVSLPKALHSVLNLHVVVHSLSKPHPNLPSRYDSRRSLGGRVVHETSASLAE